MPNGPRKLTKKMRASAHKLVGIDHANSMVLLGRVAAVPRRHEARRRTRVLPRDVRPAFGVPVPGLICPLAGRTKRARGQSSPKPQMFLPPSTQTQSRQKGTATRARCANALARRRDGAAAPNLSAPEDSLPLKRNGHKTPERH